MAKNNKGCTRAPLIAGELSKLYLDLYQMLVKQYNVSPVIARLLTNVLYIQYKSNKDVQDFMDRQNSNRNELQEHSAKDVFDVLNGTELVEYSKIEVLKDLKLQEGVMYDLSSSTVYNTWREAYSTASRINHAHPNTLSAYVIRTDNGYEVKVEVINPSNMTARVNAEIEFKVMEFLESAMNSKGLPMSVLDYAGNLLYGKNYLNLVDWLTNTPNTQPKYLFKEDIKRLILLQLDVPIISRLLTKFGDVDTLAETYYKFYRDLIEVTQDTSILLLTGMERLLYMKGLDPQHIKEQIKEIIESVKKESPEVEALNLYNELHRLYGIGRSKISISMDNIHSISNVLQASIAMLGSKLLQIKDYKGKDESYFETLKRIDLLQKILDSKVSNLGMVETLDDILKDIQESLEFFKNTDPSASDLKHLLEYGTLLRETELKLTRYTNVLNSYIVLDKLQKDIEIDAEDIKTIKLNALNILETIGEVKKAIGQNKEIWFMQTLYLIMPANSPMTLEEAAAALKTDASIFDRLYDIAQISHVPTAILGAFMQKQYDSRTLKLASYLHRIAEISGLVNHNTEFMYEKIKGTYYIVSEYDWEKYHDARNAYINHVFNKGLTGYRLELAIDQWEKRNTEEHEVYREVDEEGNIINVRYERFPKLPKFRKNFGENWTIELAIAYILFLKIKAEIESKFPAYALGLYTPPLVRKSAADKFFSGNIKASIKEKFEQRFKIREDTLGYGLVDEDGNVVLVKADASGLSNDIIPIYYINRLKDQNDLFLNMSAGLLHLAGTAVNYEAMSEIQGMVEEFGDYINDKPSGAKMESSGINYGYTTYSTPIKSTKRRSKVILDNYKRRLLYNNDMSTDSIGWRMFANTISEATSVAALSLNVFGAINNRLEGIQQGLIESLTKDGSMDLDDFMWAWAVMWGNGVTLALPNIGESRDGKVSCGAFWRDIFSGRPNSLLGLMVQRLDPKKDEFDNIIKTQFRSNWARALFANIDLKFIMYQLGENMNNIPLILGIARHLKVVHNEKVVKLTSVLTRVEQEDGSFRLGVKKGTTDLHGEPIDEAYFDRLSDNIGAVSERLNGGMSKQVQGELASTILGAAVLKLRQWMVAVGSEAFRGTHINWRTGEKRTGALPGVYKTTLLPLYKGASALKDASRGTPWSDNWSKTIKDYTALIASNYKNLNREDKQAAGRFLIRAAFITVLGYLVDTMLLKGFKDHKDEQWFKMLFYFIKRRYKDSLFHGAPDLRHLIRWGETVTTISDLTASPFAHANVIKDILYPVTNLEDYGQTVERGVNKGQDRYLTNWSRKWILPLKLYDKLRGIDETDDLINSLGGSFKKYSMKKEYEELTGEKVKNRKKKKETEEEEFVTDQYVVSNEYETSGDDYVVVE